MSVPTSRTVRSPFARRPFSSAAVPGAPDADTRTVDVLQDRSIRSAASWSRRRSFSSSSIARIVSPIRVPG